MMLFLQHFRDLGAVLEGENYSAALVDGHMIDQSVCKYSCRMRKPEREG